MAEIVRHAEAWPAACTAPRHATGVALGFWPNFGHFIWQEISGLAEILAVHGPGAVSHVLVGPHAELGVAGVFPELADPPILSLSDKDMFEATWQLPFQHLRPIGVLIHPTLPDRIMRAAEQEAHPAAKARIAELSQRHFIVWITLRKNKKVWLQQIDGHVAVMRRLAAEVGPLAVVIDGWANTREDATAIRQALEPDVTVVDIIGRPVYDLLLWARAAHLYSAVVGSQLYVNSYFARRPGVAHGNRRHLDQATYWAAQSLGSCVPDFMTRSEVGSGDDLFDDYDFPPDLLYRKLHRLIRRHYPDRLAGAAQDDDNDLPALVVEKTPPAPAILPLGEYLESFLQRGLAIGGLMLEPSAQIERPAPFATSPIDTALAPHGGLLLDPDFRRYRARASFAVALPAATVLGCDGVVLHGGTVLPDTLPYLNPGPHHAAVAAREDAGIRLHPGVLPPNRAIPQPGFCGFAAGWQDTGHWLVGGVPRAVVFARLRTRERGLKLLLPPLHEGSLQAQTIGLLGISPDEVIELSPTDVAAVDRLVLTNSFDLWSVSPFSRDAAHALAATVGPLGADDIASGTRLYIRQPDHPDRPGNLADMEARLAAEGFVPIDLAPLSLRQRIAVMRRARHVVSFHGSALAHILFCLPGTRVLELFSPAAPQPLYWSIAACCGLGYGYVAGERSDPGSHVLPHEHLHAALDRLLRAT